MRLAREGDRHPEPSLANSLGVSHGSVLDYNTNKQYRSTSVDGDTCCAVGPGDIKRVQITFPAPPGAKKVGISIGDLGTFDDVVIP